MTCREKLKLEHPDRVGSIWSGGCNGCPHSYGYLPEPRKCSRDCNECWDQEIPETKIKKENNIMTPTKKTKAELLEELEQTQQTVCDLKKELKNLERYKQYEDMANELKAMHTAFMNSGFSDEQAYDLLKTMTQAVVPTALRGMGL